MERKVFGWQVFLLAVILLGCSGSDNKDKVTDEDFYPDHAAQEKPPGPGENGVVAFKPVNRAHYHTVEIKQMKFVPAELSVEKGDTVVWVNNDITKHDVTEQQSHAWSSKEMAIGASWMMVADKSADYYCSIHVVMKGKLSVKE